MIAQRCRKFAREKPVPGVAIECDQFFYCGKRPETLSPFPQKKRVIQKDPGIRNLLK